MPGGRGSLDDLAAWRVARAERAMRARLGDAPAPFPPADPALGERLGDVCRPEPVRRAWDEARSGGEASRRAHRGLAPLWLDAASAEADLELARRRRRLGPEAGAPELALARDPDPAARRRRFGTWLRHRSELDEPREARVAAREEAARRAGAPSLVAYLDAAEPVPAGILAAGWERGAIEPLDDVVRAAVREQALRAGLGPACPVDAADGPYLESGFGGRRPPAREACAAAAGGLAERVGRGRIGIEDRTLDPADTVAAGALLDRAARVWGVLPGVDGPAALRSTLGAWGRGLREAFVARRRGIAAVVLADAAHATAAEVLFRRLAACPVFLAEARVRGMDGHARRDLAVAEAVAPRRAWAYVSLVADGVPPGDPRVDATWIRATGRPALPSERDALAESDPSASAVLRGTAFGLLVEERLRTRYGRAWFGERAAAAWLHDLWDADCEHTVEEMAAALDLGTIEPAPIADACRPD